MNWTGVMMGITRQMTTNKKNYRSLHPTFLTHLNRFEFTFNYLMISNLPDVSRVHTGHSFSLLTLNNSQKL